MATLQITSMRQEVQTIDEGVHLTAGVSYWQKRDFRLNEEHPPLIKLLAALPVIISRPHINYDSPSWINGDQWAFAREFLYKSGNNADHLLFLGRLPMVVLSLGLGLVLYLWGRKLAGDWAGLLTLGWYAFDPNFLGHGHYITTDVGVTLGYALTLYVLVRLLEHWTWKRLLIFGLVFGLAQMTKFSAAFLLPLCVLIAAAWTTWYTERRRGWTAVRHGIQVLGLALAGLFIVAFVTYMGQVKAGRDDAWVQSLLRERTAVLAEGRLGQQPKITQRLIAWFNPDTAFHPLYTLANDVSIPAWSYVKGFIVVVNHDYWGHLAYLNGQYSNFGWWWYFPFALLVKTPFATLLALLLATVALTRAVQKFQLRLHPGFIVISSASLAYLAWSLTSNINLGIRHIFPVYLALFLTLGVFGAQVIARGRKPLRWLLGGIGALYILTSLLAFPTYTAYFSEIVGGASNGPQYLVDSNNDWGQDVKRLNTFLTTHNIPYVCMSYFGQADLTYYGIDFRYLQTKVDPHTPADVNCVVAISVTSLLSQDGAYWWLKQYIPDAKIGGTIYVYDFRNGKIPKIAN
ncbi:MAG: glycosyltransferase family 39 protein [bacterium]|nr:glycosyltransferase family 39 protein [bacterium]